MTKTKDKKSSCPEAAQKISASTGKDDNSTQKLPSGTKTDFSRLLVIDCEADSKYPERAEILEIGMVLLDLSTGEIQRLFEEIIKPRREISQNSWIFYNSSLRYEDVINLGVNIDRCRNEIQNILDTYPATAYNQSYDFTLLGQYEFEIPYKCSDLMYFATDILKIPYNQWKYKWPSVQECLHFARMNEIEPHRALRDAELEAELIYFFMEKHNFKPIRAKTLCDTKEKNVLRYSSKIETYTNLIREIRERELDATEIIEHMQSKLGYCQRAHQRLINGRYRD